MQETLKTCIYDLNCKFHSYKACHRPVVEEAILSPNLSVLKFTLLSGQFNISLFCCVCSSWNPERKSLPVWKTWNYSLTVSTKDTQKLLMCLFLSLPYTKILSDNEKSSTQSLPQVFCTSLSFESFINIAHFKRICFLTFLIFAFKSHTNTRWPPISAEYAKEKKKHIWSSWHSAQKGF